MRVLMISDVSFPRVNGVSTSIHTFRSQLHQLGHETVLIAPDYPGMTQDEDPTVIRMKSRRVPGDPEDRLMSYRGIQSMLPQLAKQQFDLVHVHTPFIAHYAGTKLARRLGIPVVESYHTYFEEYGQYYMPLLPRSFMRFFARRLTVSQCAAIDALVVPSPQMIDALRSYGVKVRAERIPTGIDTSSFCGGDGDAFRRQYQIASDRPVLVHISRVAYEKNIDFILRVVARLKEDVPNVLLVVAGDGPALARLKQLSRHLEITENCLFVGYLNRETTLLDCYRSASAFVFASRTETQGLVLLEALALGVPVVSTAVMGTADVLREVKGAIIAPEDEAGFAQAIHSLLTNPSLEASLRAVGPQDAAAWSARSMAERLVNLYQEVIAAKRAGYFTPLK